MLLPITRTTKKLNWEGSASTYRLVNITNDRASNDQESRALESSQDPEDEKRGQVRRQCGPNREGSEQRCAHD